MRTPRPRSEQPFAPAASIVTGGASGIGRALATALVARGGTVVVADVDEPRAEAVSSALSAAGPGRALARRVDVADSAAVDRLVDQTVEELGRLDLLCNNAGVLFSGPFVETTDRHWAKAVEVNLLGVVHGTRAAFRVMPGLGGGHVLNTGSLAGLMPAPVMTPYTATKWGVVGLSQALRAEGHPLGIGVSVLCPGYVDTPLIDQPYEPTPSYREGSFRRNIRALQPRLTRPDAVAEAALRGLAHDKAIIQVGALAHLLSRAQRFAPRAVELGNRVQARR